MPKEIEDGRALYEVELSLNGLTRDLTFDAQGKVVADQQQIALSGRPAGRTRGDSESCHRRETDTAWRR